MRQSLWSDEDDCREVDGQDEHDVMEEEEVRRGSRRRRNPFIEDECGVTKRGREEDE